MKVRSVTGLINLLGVTESEMRGSYRNLFKSGLVCWNSSEETKDLR